MKKNLLYLLLLSGIISSHLMKAEVSALLHLAAKQNNVREINNLINEGVDVNAQDQNGNTPLHIAAWYTHPEVIKALLKAGANPQLENNLGQTPLNIAAKRPKNLSTIMAFTGASVRLF